MPPINSEDDHLWRESDSYNQELELDSSSEVIDEFRTANRNLFDGLTRPVKSLEEKVTTADKVRLALFYMGVASTL